MSDDPSIIGQQVTAGDSIDDTSAAPLLLVRATVNLVGLPVGQHACVDPTRDSISEWLNAGYLVALPQDQQHHCDGVDATEAV